MAEVLSQDEIDQLLSAISAGEISTEEVHQPKDQRKIKIYDFKRPDKFSKDQIRTVSIMHETFARLTTTSLSAQLRSLVHVHVASVDQLTYEEFIRSIPNPTTLAVVDMDPLKGSAILEIDPAITFSIIDRLFGGQGEGAKFSRELTDIEQSVMEGIIVRVLGNLRESWSTVIDLRPRLGGIETNPQFAGIVPPSEMVVLVTLETKVGEVEGMMNLCIPYLTIEPIISKLSAQYWYSSVRRGTTTENLNILRDRLATVAVTLSAEIGNMDITVRDVLALRPGDIIRLDSVRVADPMPLKVGDRKKFLCRPGVLGNKLAVQIVKKLEEIEQAEFEELATGLEEEP
jgi:flagellar motor switch protein FliM